jgi:hypothetical protein
MISCAIAKRFIWIGQHDSVDCGVRHQIPVTLLFYGALVRALHRRKDKALMTLLAAAPSVTLFTVTDTADFFVHTCPTWLQLWFRHCGFSFV